MSIRYCRLESYWEYDRVCSNPVYGNVKASCQGSWQWVPKPKHICR